MSFSVRTNVCLCVYVCVCWWMVASRWRLCVLDMYVGFVTTADARLAETTLVHAFADSNTDKQNHSLHMRMCTETVCHQMAGVGVGGSHKEVTDWLTEALGIRCHLVVDERGGCIHGIFVNAHAFIP